MKRRGIQFPPFVIRNSDFVISLPPLLSPLPCAILPAGEILHRSCRKNLQKMQIWPAIDLRGGKCVRLRQGDYGRETIYGDDPAAMAKKWVSEGAQCLHLVDLDGARDGSNANLAAVKAIVP